MAGELAAKPERKCDQLGSAPRMDALPIYKQACRAFSFTLPRPPRRDRRRRRSKRREAAGGFAHCEPVALPNAPQLVRLPRNATVSSYTRPTKAAAIPHTSGPATFQGNERDVIFLSVAAASRPLRSRDHEHVGPPSRQHEKPFGPEDPARRRPGDRVGHIDLNT